MKNEWLIAVGACATDIDPESAFAPMLLPPLESAFTAAENPRLSSRNGCYADPTIPADLYVADFVTDFSDLLPSAVKLYIIPG